MKGAEYEMAGLFGAQEGGVVHGDWDTRVVDGSEAFRMVDPIGCDIVTATFWFMVQAC